MAIMAHTVIMVANYHDIFVKITVVIFWAILPSPNSYMHTQDNFIHIHNIIYMNNYHAQRFYINHLDLSSYIRTCVY